MAPSEDAKKLTSLFRKKLQPNLEALARAISDEVAQFEIAPTADAKKIIAFALIEHADELVKDSPKAALAVLHYIMNKSEPGTLQVQRCLSLAAQWTGNGTIDADHSLGFLILLESRKIHQLQEYVDLCKTTVSQIEKASGTTCEKIALLGIVRYGFDETQTDMLDLIDTKISDLRLAAANAPVELRPCG